MKPVLLLMRHGETELNKDKEFRGWLDPSLNETGIEQAHDAARFLKRFPVSLIVHSPLKRTMQTAEIIGAPKIEEDGRLLPLNVGVFAGKSKDPKDKYVAIFEYYLENRDRKIPRGESVDAFEARYKPLLMDAIHYGEDGKDVALLAGHTSNITAAQNILMGLERKEEKGNLIDPGGIAGVFRVGHKYEVRALFRPSKGREASDKVW